MKQNISYKATINRFLNYNVLSYKQLTLSTIVLPMIIGYYLSTIIDSFSTDSIAFIIFIVILSLIMIYSVGVKLLKNRLTKIMLIPTKDTDILKCEAAIDYLKTTKQKAKKYLNSDIPLKKKQRTLTYIDDIDTIKKNLEDYILKLKNSK